MRKLAFALAATVAFGIPATALAADTKIGILMDVTGPIASFIPPIQNAANLALRQVNEQGGVLDGNATAVFEDTTGTAKGAVEAAGKLVKEHNVPVVVGAFMSATTIAAAEEVTIPAGVVQISPAASSDAISAMKDNDLVYRIAASNLQQGQALAKMAIDAGIRKVAVTYADAGKGVAASFIEAFKEADGEVTGSEAHGERKGSYLAQLDTLAKGKADALAVFASAGGSGATIVKEAIEGKFFSRFVGGEGLRDGALIKAVGSGALKDSFFSAPAAADESPGRKALHEAFNKAFKDGADKAFVDQTYDATFLALLAIEKAGSRDKTKIAAALREVAMAPGEKVGPGEWAKAKALIKDGKDIDYEGAGGAYEFDANGDVPVEIGKFMADGDGFKQVPITD
ncbi:MAG: ABC transporter substrate-binding protein [Rhizobiales bacterium]|nr:ABC transporter substrate-binding protein [Hyphomicrobiales bacterium]